MRKRCSVLINEQGFAAQRGEVLLHAAMTPAGIQVTVECTDDAGLPIPSRRIDWTPGRLGLALTAGDDRPVALSRFGGLTVPPGAGFHDRMAA